MYTIVTVLTALLVGKIQYLFEGITSALAKMNIEMILLNFIQSYVCENVTEVNIGIIKCFLDKSSNVIYFIMHS